MFLLQKVFQVVVGHLVLRVVLVVRSDQFVARRIVRQLIAVPRVQIRRDLIGVLVDGLLKGEKTTELADYPSDPSLVNKL